MRWDVIHADYVASAVKPDQYPPGDEPEIAFIGRSNVGKSSLINSICRRNKLARTSGEPGKTRTVNFYRVEMKREDGHRGKLFLVDLPGYGYARLGQAARNDLLQWTRRYFTSSKRLCRVFLLVDIRRTLQTMDAELLQWLWSQNLPVTVIATKVDKLTKNQVQAALKAIRDGLGTINRIEVLPYSAFTASGREETLNTMAQVAGIDGTDNL